MEPLPVRYRKQTLFSGIGEQGQRRLLAAKVLVVGCGALGSVIAEALARAGVGFIRLVDRDFVELSNLQRQVLYNERDVADKTPKAIAASNALSNINSEITIEPHVEDVSSANIRALAEGVDCIVDGTDNFETRFLINDLAVEQNLPWVHGGCVGSGGQVMTIVPGQTPCLRCLIPEIPDAGTTESCDTAGVLGPAVNVVASLQAMGALKILSGQSAAIEPELLVVDVWDGTVRKMSLKSLNEHDDCRCCSGGERQWLSGSRGAQSTVLCGRNSVQVSPSERMNASLDDMAARLEPSGIVKLTPFLLTFRPHETEYEITLFKDGRAIITGTEESATARSLYAQYVGG